MTSAWNASAQAYNLIEPLIEETWVVDGKRVTAPVGDADALYIRPMLHKTGAVHSGTKVLHSLVLDNNVLADLVEGGGPRTLSIWWVYCAPRRSN